MAKDCMKEDGISGLNVTLVVKLATCPGTVKMTGFVTTVTKLAIFPRIVQRLR